MANVKDIKSKAVKVTLSDGVERTLKYTLNAMAELEDKYGSVAEAFKKLDEGSFKAIRFILWVGLVHGDPSLTEQTVGNLIDMQYMSEFMNNIGDALGSDMPESTTQLEGPKDPNA